jgi:hypothetical protein
MSDNGLYAGYNSVDQFRRDFKRHLELELNHPKYLWLPLPEATGNVQESPVSKDALRLLRAAVNDDGLVMHQELLSGDGLRAGDQEFLDGTPRSAAKWKAILYDLVERRALERVEDTDVYRVTAYGYNIVDQSDGREKASETTNVALNVSGPPDAQVLLVRSNHALSLTQLDFLTSTEACICSQSLSQQGTDITVQLDHTKAAELFAAPRSDRNPNDYSGPAKLRLLFRVNNRQKQAIVPVILIAKTVKNKQWITLTGSATFDV